ncbi:hypothetical protein HPB52_003442 [Rhipicephalus sanguineus]|uniref:Peptidase S54 rhomboid domain-containing protein n=1 Tax=Rhipicephalus sanguineus TaxID=34632 RepID=A0A9D4QG48_RHISA|nr:hypothetical protein HPB52_003442 [Rhipicephalus sanguineus]
MSSQFRLGAVALTVLLMACLVPPTEQSHKIKKLKLGAAAAAAAVGKITPLALAAGAAAAVRPIRAKIGGGAAALVVATGGTRRLGNHWPLATIALAALQVFVHWLSTYRCDHSLCASVATILEDGHWSGVVLAAFHHENRWQLGVNVVSFLWKGVVLETTIGTPLFVVAMAKLVLMVGVANTLLNLVCDLLLNYTVGYDDICMCTFAGVLVALKVVNEKRHRFNAFHWGLLELELPPPRVTWLEIIVLHMTSSRSLTTLLSGLLVGFFFTESIVSLKQGDEAALFFKAPLLPTTYGIAGLLLATHLLWPDLDPCVSFRVVFEQGRWQQLLLPSLYTFSSYHLVYVVLSLLSLGRQMEPRYGHYNFLLLVLFVTVCVNVTHCLLAWILSRHPVKLIRPLLPPSLRDTCFSGFTGSLLTLKMLLQKERPESDYDFASFQMAVPHWFGLMTEVAHLYMYTARAWLLGHMAGIAVGLTLTVVHLPVLRPSQNIGQDILN